MSILANCGILFVFKYFNFFTTNLSALSGFLHWNYSLPLLQLALPIGLSFHTFQSLSYIFEVYKGRQKAESNFGIYALYVMFYPQLVAGIIERPGHLLTQFYKKHPFDTIQVTLGLQRMVIGFFKKTVIADRLALLVNQVYNNPTAYHGAPLIIATIAFAWQIYMDFSGYTDIALGAAQVMGFRLIENFNFPYGASSVKNFWARWHISLSSWFRDYIYIPLGGNRVSWIKHARNILMSFFLSGLWNGANWTFILWGVINGAYLVTYFMLEKQLKKVIFPYKKLCGIILTFSFITFSWIFFRANSASDSIYIVTHLFDGFGKTIQLLVSFHYTQLIQNIFYERGGIGITEKVLLGVTLGIFFVEYVTLRFRERNLSTILSFIIFLFMTLCILNFSVGQEIPFIYFQF